MPKLAQIAADEFGPALARAAGQLERAHRAVRPMLVDPPCVADRVAR